jgi:hypothetical protein
MEFTFTQGQTGIKIPRSDPFCDDLLRAYEDQLPVLVDYHGVYPNEWITITHAEEVHDDDVWFFKIEREKT